MRSGVLIGTYPIKIVLIGGILGFLIITFAFKIIKGKITRKDMHCKLRIEIDNKIVDLEAIIDTGNFLRDPITKMPVIVVEKEALRESVPDKLIDNLQEIISSKDVEIGEYISKIRLIPFSSLGKENGLLIGIKANSVYINHDGENKLIKNIIIGIYDGVLSKNNKYSALVGLALLEEDLITQ